MVAISYRVYCLQFDYEAIVHHKVRPSKTHSFFLVEDFNWGLDSMGDVLTTKLYSHRLLVNIFVTPTAKGRVDLGSYLLYFSDQLCVALVA